jgi:hypothetical protein
VQKHLFCNSCVKESAHTSGSENTSPVEGLPATDAHTIKLGMVNKIWKRDDEPFLKKLEKDFTEIVSTLGPALVL